MVCVSSRRPLACIGLADNKAVFVMLQPPCTDRVGEVVEVKILRTILRGTFHDLTRVR